ncbi:MAG: 50S ribosomal protein L37ae [Candidatus Thorarchaeota archaeon]|nr:MAG: 50S ribosomal protein L37ae [Candidatus Thorarchaeota archaeon]
MARTKKVGSTGRFGARYGAKLRRRVLDLERRRREPHRCPSCATRSLQRKAVGLWSCRKCGLLFAGGAYVPYTDAGKAAKRAIAQRVSGDFLALRDDADEEEIPEFMETLKKEEEPEPALLATDVPSSGEPVEGTDEEYFEEPLE